MSVLLSFSEHHFHPQTLNDPKTSSGLIAKQIYNFFVKKYGVESTYYVDPENFDLHKFKEIKFDKFIGLDVNFISIAKIINANENILVAVNQHPVFRRKIITKFLKSNHSINALHSSDGVYSISKQANFADKILVIGNTLTLNTYKKIYGNHKILVNSYYDVQKLEINPLENWSMAIAYIGSLNFRKCIDIYLDIIKSDLFTEKFKLVLVGKAVNSYWFKKITELLSGVNFEWYESIEPDSEKLIELLNKTKFAMFLTREEGVSGSYLLISKAKIPILTTKYVGIDPIDEFNFDIDSDFSIGMDKLSNLINLSRSDFVKLREKSNNFFESRLGQINSIEHSLDLITKYNVKKVRFKYLIFNLKIILNSYMDIFNHHYLKCLFSAHYIYQKQRMFFLLSIFRNR